MSFILVVVVFITIMVDLTYMRIKNERDEIKCLELHNLWSVLEFGKFEILIRFSLRIIHVPLDVGDA